MPARRAKTHGASRAQARARGGPLLLVRAIERAAMTTSRTNATLPRMLLQVERWLLVNALHTHGDDTKRAAAALGITRETMREKLTKLGIQPAPREVKNKTVLRIAPKLRLVEVLKQVQRWLVTEALRDHGDNKTRAAAALGIRRETLHKMLPMLHRQPAPREIERLIKHVAPNQGTLRDRMHQVERWHLAEALREHRGNKSRAAAVLGIGRDLLYKKMHKLGMRPADYPLAKTLDSLFT